MAWLKCYDCGEVFRAEDAGARPAQLEDGLLPWESTSICPACGGDALEELDACPLCGAPVTARGADFCDECISLIDGAFRRAIETVHAERGGEIGRLTSLMFDRAEERDFYR